MCGVLKPYLFPLQMLNCFSNGVLRHERIESGLQVKRLDDKAKGQLLRMWWIVHCCDGHRTQEEISDKPQSLRREGVFSQFTEAFKTNLATLEKGLQIRFFQEKSKGSAFSAHCSQTPCCFKVNEWFSRFVLKKIVLYLWSFFSSLLLKGLD